MSNPAVCPPSPAQATTALVVAASFGLAAPAAAAVSDSLPDRHVIEQTIRLANDYWITNNPPGTAGWRRGAYHTGNQRAFEITGDPDYLAWAELWAATNDWERGPEGLTHADAHCCGQTYIDLHRLNPQPARLNGIDGLTGIKPTMDYTVASPAVDYWSWIDAFFMAGPTLAKLAVTLDDPAYSDKLRAMYLDMRDVRDPNSGFLPGGLFDPDAGLWYRDKNWIWPNRTSANDQKVFWARGNGWVIAGLARILDELPPAHPDYPLYSSMLQTMAAALVAAQDPDDGFWRASILDPLDVPNPETSGSAFFTYAIAWGINHGVLDQATYLPVVAKAWNGMSTVALHPDGKVGYIQNVGASPAPTDYEQTYDFGVGAFLLAGCELTLLADQPPITAMAGPDRSVTDTDGSGGESVTLDGSGTYDPDGKAVTYEWLEGTTSLGFGILLPVSLPVATHTITLRITDIDSNTYEDSLEITVGDLAVTILDASSWQAPHLPENTLDGDFATRWSAEGSQWIAYDIGALVHINSVSIAFLSGDQRVSYFSVDVSQDGVTWTPILTDSASSGTTTDPEIFDFPDTVARYLRINGSGNSVSAWNSYLEVEIDWQTPPATPAWTLVDDFEIYQTGPLASASGGGWATTSGSQSVATDPAGGSNKVAAVAATATQATASRRLATIPVGSTATLFMRVRTTTGDPGLELADWVFGASDAAAPTEFADFEGYARIADAGDPGIINLDLRDGTTFTTVGPAATDTWYNVWLVLEQGPDTATAGTATCHATTGGLLPATDPSTISASGAFRTQPLHGDLVSLFLVNYRPGTTGYVDDIYLFNGGANLSHPLDSDADGLPDRWEDRHFGNNDGSATPIELARQSATDDGYPTPDADGLDNLAELAAGTNPNNADTDGDGYLDGVEVATGSDPDDDASLPVSLAGFTLVEDFEGSGFTTGQSFAGINGWQADVPERSLVADDPDAGPRSKVALLVQGDEINDVFKSLGPLRISEGTTGTVFFELFVPADAGVANLNFGLSDLAAPDNYASFEPQMRFAGPDIFPRDGDVFTDTGFDYPQGRWLRVWLVADNAADTVDIHLDTPEGGSGRVPVATGYGFRNRTTSPLATFLAIQWTSKDVFFDNIHVDPSGANLTVPAALQPQIRITSVRFTPAGDLEITFSPGGDGHVLTSSADISSGFAGEPAAVFNHIDTFTVPAASLAPGRRFFRVEQP